MPPSPVVPPLDPVHVAVGVQLVRRHHRGRIPRRPVPPASRPYPSARPVRVRPPYRPTPGVIGLAAATSAGLIVAAVALGWWTAHQAHVAHVLFTAPASDPRHLEVFVSAVEHGLTTAAGAVGVLALVVAGGLLAGRAVAWGRARRHPGAAPVPGAFT